MISRGLAAPSGSFFLFGPWGTGKSTWVKRCFPKSLRIDLVFRESDLKGLRLFIEDYPEARGHLFYGGTRSYQFGPIQVMPLAEGLVALPGILGAARGKRRS